MALSCIISEIERDIGGKSRFFLTTALDAPTEERGFRRNIAITFGMEELEWFGSYLRSLRYQMRRR